MMKNPALLSALPLVLALACTSDDTATSETATGSASESATATATSTSTSGASMTGTQGTSAGSMSDSATQGTDSTGVSTSTSGTTTGAPETTGSTGSGSTTMGVSESNSSTSSTSSTTGDPDPVCGNGVVEDGEECDDGNDVDNDKCSNACMAVPCDQQMGGGMGVFDFSYLWVSNSPAGTVSKIDTASATEVARYISGPPGKTDPSRTSVSGDGRFAVAVNRNGGITMFAAEEEDCVDKNNNGMIETSNGPGNVLPWGTDECQIWNKDLPGTSNQGPRPVSWNIGPQDPDTCEYGMGDVWVGWYNQPQNTGYFRLLNGEDGATLQDVSVPNWSGMNWGPYGGAIDSDNNFWVTGWGQNGPVVKIDGQNYTAKHYGSAGGWIYGMGLDLQGNTWAAGCGSANVYRFDKQAESWKLVANVGGSCLRGLQVDSEGRAFIAKNGGCGLAVIDTLTQTVINANVPIPGCSTPVGVSIDAEGFVWVVDQGVSRAFKIDPDSYQVVAQVTGLVSPYTYSDMTGAGIFNQIAPQ